MNQIDPKAEFVRFQSEHEAGTEKPRSGRGSSNAAGETVPKAAARSDSHPAGKVQSKDALTSGDPSRPSGILKPVDARLIARALNEGPAKVAQQGDLVKMHKSRVESMRRLGAGIGDQVAQDAASEREALSARIDGMERAVNGMEAVLRIQLTPEIQSMIDEALARRTQPSGRRRALRQVALAVLVLASLAAGAMFSEELRTLATQAEAWIRGMIGY